MKIAKLSQNFKLWKQDLSRIRYQLTKNPISVLGLVIVLVLVAIAIMSPYIAPYPGDGGGITRFQEAKLPPSIQHLFGTDAQGRDVLSRVILGSRISLYIGGLTILVASCIGITLGLIAGFKGGWVDQVIMRAADLVLSIPSLVFALFILACLPQTLNSAMMAISVAWWPTYARLTRAQALSVKKEDFIDASRSYGAGTLHIAFKEILPNVMPTIIVKCTLDVGFAILFASTLGFLGLGIVPPTPEWGTMTANGRLDLPSVWWPSFFPGLMIFLAVFGFNMLGDGLRDILGGE
jgi:peptide/nickel transport system permease protein